MKDKITQALSLMERALELLDEGGEKNGAAELQRAVDTVRESGKSSNVSTRD